MLGIFTIIFLSSCSTSKLIYETQANESQVHFFLSKGFKSKRPVCKFYVRVDSSNVRMVYSFLPFNIYKIKSNNHHYIYRLVTNQPASVRMTKIDSVVFIKANYLLDSLSFRNVKRSDGATGFALEKTKQ